MQDDQPELPEPRHGDTAIGKGLAAGVSAAEKKLAAKAATTAVSKGPSSPLGTVAETATKKLTDKVAERAERKADLTTESGRKKAEDARAASDIVAGAAGGAAAGAKGGAWGAVAGGALGGLKSAVANTRARKKVILTLALPLVLVLVVAFAPAIISTMIVITAVGSTASVEQSDNSAVAGSVAASFAGKDGEGTDSGDPNAAANSLIMESRQLGKDYPDVPWQLIGASLFVLGDDAFTGQKAQLDLTKLSNDILKQDPKGTHRNIAAGALRNGVDSSQHLYLVDSKAGGKHETWEQHQRTQKIMTGALTKAGATKSEAQDIWDLALSWSLGVIGCTDPADGKESTPDKPGSGAGGGAWLTPGSDKYKVAKQIFDTLTQDFGTSGAFAAGVLGNAEQESSFNVDITNSLGAKGLFQFLPASKAEPWMKDGGWTIENQVRAVWGLEFENGAVWGYVERNAPGTFKSMEDWLSTDDAEAAAKAFLLGYERPGAHEAMEEKRKQNAKAANEVFNQKNLKADPKKWKIPGSHGGKGSETGSDSNSSGTGGECGNISMEDTDSLIVGGWTIPTTKPASDAGVTLPGSNNSGWWSTYSGEAQHAAGATDWIRPVGTPAKAAAAGKVVDKYCGAIGCFMSIQHTPTLFTIYGHIGSSLNPGDKVKAGQNLGPMVDISNIGSPPHVHFAVSSVWQQDVSKYTKSIKFLRARGVHVGPGRAGDPIDLAQ